MYDLLKDWEGSVTIDGVDYDSIRHAETAFKELTDDMCIVLHTSKPNVNKVQNTALQSNDKQFIVTVKQYMTKKSTPEFDFMSKFNNNEPMPLRIMVGTVEKETRGMYYMKLHASITGTKMLTCMKCGRPITNPVSQYFGMGPECGQHNYTNPFSSTSELRDAVEDYKKNVLSKITWEGWVIKSAILDMTEVVN